MKKLKREVVVDGDIALIPLTMGKTAIIDASDIDLVAGYNWTCAARAGGIFYAYRNVTIEKGRMFSVLLHRVIAGALDGELVDHKDGNGLNNVRSNVRICTHSENMMNRRKPAHNRSGYKGVKKVKSGRWEAGIRKGGKYHYLGLFDCPKDASEAYVSASRRLHGNFSCVTR